MSGYQENSEDDAQVQWNVSVERDLKSYLIRGAYPESCGGKVEKRNFRKRAQKFVVVNDQLCYKSKGAHLIALAKKEEQKQTFQVRTTMSFK